MTSSMNKESTLSLKPIPLGRGLGPKSMIFYHMGFGEMMDGIGYVWLVKGSQKNILIDGGMDLASMRALGFQGEEVNNLEDALKREGLSLEDIDIIIATHLHWEHIARAKDFPRAKVIVQRRELIGALNPSPVLLKGYPQDIIEYLFEANKFKIVDGDIEIEPGIKLMLTPGHTAGGQSVILQAGDKKVVVTGFCSVYENFFPSDPKLDCIPIGTYEEIVPAYESLIKVKEMADIIVPLHEPKFLEVDSIP